MRKISVSALLLVLFFLFLVARLLLSAAGSIGFRITHLLTNKLTILTCNTIFDDGFMSPSHAAMEKEKTLAMIKPDGLSGNYMDKIRKVILESGYDIIREMMVRLDAGNVTQFYDEHSKKSFFPSLVEYMTSGPVLIMVLEKPNAISDWRALIGPTDSRKAKVSHPNSIRAMCGLDSAKNCVHGSDSPQSAVREISFFFGDILPGFVKHDEL